MKLFELFIGFRYLKAKKSQGFISFNTVLSMAVVFIGVFILIVVISVLNGFQSKIKDKILDVDAHVTVSRTGGNMAGMRDYRDITEKILEVNRVESAEPILQGQGLFRFRSNISPVMVRGMGERDEIVEDIRKFIVDGDDESFGRNGILIGEEMARNYNIRLGDTIEVIVPRGTMTARTGVEPGMSNYRVSGLFKTGYYEFDTRLVVLSLRQAQQLYVVGDTAWAIAVKVDDIYRMNQVAKDIRSKLGSGYMTITAEEKNVNLFYALKLERFIMTVILFLVIVSAAFTIMGTLVMVVMEKRRAIGILKAMGAGQRSIMSIFVLEGFLIGVAGTVAGVIFGIAAALNLEAIILKIEVWINTVMAFVYELFNLGFYSRISIVPTNIYYIDSIPAEVNPEFVVFIAIFAVFLSTLAAIFPAWSASRLRPVETIRYE